MASWRVGRIAGISVHVHFTFPLVLVLGAVQWSAHGAAGAAFGAGLTALLFACVLLHELGHALVARRHGLSVPDITLLPIGGVARVAELPRSPREELLVAAAGPAVNVAIAALLGPVLLLLDVPLQAAGGPPSVSTLLAWLFVVNVALTVFNLLPVFPLDGGRILRAALALRLPQVRATEIATYTGQGLAVLLGLFALATGALLTAVIAVFLFLAAARERAMFRERDRLERAELERETVSEPTAGELVTPGGIVLHPDDPVATARAALGRTGQAAFAVLDRGRVVGLVTSEALAAAPPSDGPVALLLSPALRVPVSAPRGAVLRALEEHGLDVAVVEDRGVLVGLLPRARLLAADLAAA